MFREKPYLLFHNKQVAEIRIYLMSQYSGHLGQVRSYKHVKPQQDSHHLETIDPS